MATEAFDTEDQQVSIVVTRSNDFAEKLNKFKKRVQMEYGLPKDINKLHRRLKLHFENVEQGEYKL